MLNLVGIKNVHWVVSQSLGLMKVILPKSWYHNLLKWLVKTPLVSFWDKIIIMKDLKMEKIILFLQNTFHIFTKK
jgi:hypothetical protein